MALNSPLGISGIILIIIGIITAVIGVIILIANQNQPKGWYIWVLMIGGIVLGIIGGIMLAIALAQRNPCQVLTTYKQRCGDAIQVDSMIDDDRVDTFSGQPLDNMSPKSYDLVKDPLTGKAKYVRTS